MKEVWKDVEGYEGRYEVSNLGRVKSNHQYKGGIMKEQQTKRGDKYVYLTKNNALKMFKISFLVARAFIENPEKKENVRYKDGIPSNCTADNLEWCDKEVKRPEQGEIMTDCLFYKNNTTKDGCTALNMLYCKLENKECAFYKRKEA